MIKEKESNLKRHEGRSDLVGEHKQGDLGQLILFVVFMIVWICDSFIFRFSTMFIEYIALWIRIVVAAFILISSGIVAKKGMDIVFGEKRDKPQVIRKGVFKIIRHPIYLGAILLYLGLIILTLSLASLLVWILIIVFYIFISKYEEKLLIKEFGDDYKQYMNDVPMLIPRLFRKSIK